MRSAGIVEVEVTANRGAGLRDGVVGLQINLLVFDGFSKALDENIVAPGSLAVHADGDPVSEKNAGIGLTQRAAAGRLGTTQPELSKILRGKFSEVSLERLMRFLTALGYYIEIKIGATKPKKLAT